MEREKGERVRPLIRVGIATASTPSVRLSRGCRYLPALMDASRRPCHPPAGLQDYWMTLFAATPIRYWRTLYFIIFCFLFLYSIREPFLRQNQLVTLFVRISLVNSKKNVNICSFIYVFFRINNPNKNPTKLKL